MKTVICPQRGRTKNCRGFVILISLWILALLSLLSLSLAQRVAINVKLVKFQRDKIKCHYAAKAAINKAIAVIETDVLAETDVPNTLNQRWSLGYDVTKSDTEYIFKDIAVGDTSFTIQAGNGLSLGSADYEGDARYGFIDEDKKININFAKYDLLRSLFEVLEFDEPDALAEAILFWRGDFPDGSDAYYGSQAVPYQAPKAPFHTLEELSLVKGFREDGRMVEQCREFLSVFPVKDSININTASPTVLKAVFFSLKANSDFAQRLVDKIVAYRAGADTREGSQDDAPILENKIKDVLKEGFVNVDEISWVETSSFPFTAHSRWFRIEAVARPLTGGAIQKRVSAVVSAEENCRVVEWHEK